MSRLVERRDQRHGLEFLFVKLLADTVHLLSAETNALKLQTATRSEVSPVWLVKANLEPFCQRHAAPHMVHELYATGRPWGIPANTLRSELRPDIERRTHK